MENYNLICSRCNKAIKVGSEQFTHNSQGVHHLTCWQDFQGERTEYNYFLGTVPLVGVYDDSTHP